MKATGIIKNKYFNVYFLLDASSSMTYKWNETIDSINAFVKTKVDESDVKYRYSVMTHKYNAKMQYDVVRDKVSQDVWVDLDYKTVRAGGFTPLYDAMGKLLDSIAPERSIVVILTDGEENSSVECSKSIITKKMKALERKMRYK